MSCREYHTFTSGRSRCDCGAREKEPARMDCRDFTNRFGAMHVFADDRDVLCRCGKAFRHKIVAAPPGAYSMELSTPSFMRFMQSMTPSGSIEVKLQGAGRDGRFADIDYTTVESHLMVNKEYPFTFLYGGKGMGKTRRQELIGAYVLGRSAGRLDITEDKRKAFTAEAEEIWPRQLRTVREISATLRLDWRCNRGVIEYRQSSDQWLTANLRDWGTVGTTTDRSARMRIWAGLIEQPYEVDA